MIDRARDAVSSCCIYTFVPGLVPGCGDVQDHFVKMQKGMGNEWFHWLSMNNLGGSQGLDA